MSHVITVIIALASFVLGFVVRGFFQTRGNVPADEKQYGKSKKTLHDNATNDDYDFYENESAKDDPKKPAEKVGEYKQVGLDREQVSIWLWDDDDKTLTQGKAVKREDIDCGHAYYVTRHKVISKGTDKTCGGPDEFAAQHKAVKDEVLAEAIRVADRCKRKPDCKAALEFQGGYRFCWNKPETDEWFLEIAYQVRVSCTQG